MHEGGRAVAVATLTRFDVRLDLLATGLARRIAERARSVVPDFLQVRHIMCGPPVSFGRSLVRLVPDAGPDVAYALHRAVERYAEESGAPVTCFKELADDEVPSLRPLEPLGYRDLPSLRSRHLPIRWRSFQEYLGAMRAGYRRQVQQTLDRAS